MKIDLNLSRSQSFRERYVLFWAMPAALLALLLLAKFAVSAQADFREHRKVHGSVLTMQDRVNRLQDREAALRRDLEQPHTRDLLREVAFVNSLIDQKQLSLTGLTAKVSELLPPQARLTSLDMPDSSGDPLVRMAVEGQSEDQLETFLINLENSAEFREPTVLGTGFEQKGAGSPVTLTCTARYVGGRPH